MPDSLSADDFAPDLEGVFLLHLEQDRVYRLTLKDIRHFPAAGIGTRQDPFALRFESADMPHLPQRIYRMESPRGKPLEIFIVPIGRQGDRIHYEAVFN